ncbi:BTAD domain-containing putative transcriptional regulator [Longispora urticae]
MHFGILGPLRVLDDSGPVPLGARNLRVLLATLLCHPNRAVDTGTLVDAIWETAPPKSAAKNLQVYVHQLRRRLGDARVVRYPHGYGVLVRDGELDADAFAALADRGDLAVRAGDLERGRTLLAEALGLWRGPAFADVADASAVRESVAGLTERHTGVLEDRIDADLALGAHHAVIAELNALVPQHPLRERLRGQQMVALYRCGRPAEALQAYQEGRKRLVEELGVEPTEELRAMQVAVLRGVDPGRGVQVSGARAPAVDAGPSTLPRDIPDFTGRAAELRRLDTLSAAPGGGAVVVVRGIGGVGKTALAVRWARTARERFPDGQFYLDLRGHGTGAPVGPGEATRLLLRMLGLSPQAVPDTDEHATAVYRSLVADRRMVVLLDNAHSVDQVRPLLPGGSGSLVLVTSRARLGGLVARDGAHRLDLGTLADAEAVDLLGDVVGRQRVRADPTAALELAHACGNLPLALRIAAANLVDGRRSLREYADLVAGGERLDALSVEGDPHSTVRAVFGTSLDRLTGDTAVLFRRIGLLPVAEAGHWIVPVLIGCSAKDGDRFVERLSDASLLAPGRDAGRFALHDLVQLCAREHADREDVAALRRCYEALLRAALRADAALPSKNYPTPAWSGPDATDSPGDADPAEWLRAEYDLLFRAARDATRRGWPDLSWRLVTSMTNFAGHQSYISEWTQVAEETLATTGDPEGVAALLLGLGGMYQARGQLPRAFPLLRRARRMFVRAGRPALAATAATQLSMAYRATGNWTAARAAVDWAIRHLADVPTAAAQRGLAQVALGNLLRTSGAAPEVALVTFEQAAASMRAAGNRVGEANALVCLSQCHSALGQLEEALELCRTAVAILTGAQDRTGLVIAACHLGRTYLTMGDVASAWTHASSALDAARESNHPHGLRTALGLAGEIAARRGDVDLALRLLGDAVAAARSTQSPVATATALLQLARAQVAAGDVPAALTTGGECVALHLACGTGREREVTDWLATLRGGQAGG